MLDTTSTLKRTPFHARHTALGAKMVPFAGFEMPIQYEGIVAEHRAVRGGVGVFDVSHMGEIRLTGPGARAYANRLVTGQVDAIPEGKAVYTPMCLESGGIVDDLLVYACGEDRLLVVNAANFEKDLAWIREHAPRGVTVRDENEITAQLAIQGPRAEDVVARIYGDRAKALEFYTFFEEGKGDDWTLVSRTGYTGEDGFEIYVRAPRALETWDRVFDAGAPALIRAIGLGARDTLRLEMGYCLYGNDIDETTNPLEAGLGWTVRMDKEDFIGREALDEVKRAGLARKLVGLVLEGERIARQGSEVTVQGEPVGTVTSGSMGISLGKPAAMAYTRIDSAGTGTKLEVRTRGSESPATVVGRPMYKTGSVRAPKPRRAT
ncbi:MAG TPA: glycine cleavage system aminomethyltransferase GcvT [Candidatus Polarisedimenticolia bacterium]|nr:glycine cleavage system aminomethyltransferase GcvT [Candidatus Polarisedimenticolia bacterium]